MSFMDYPCLGPLMLQNCKKLKTIVLKNINMSDHELLLPESITIITLDRVNWSKDVKLLLQHCTSLQKLELTNVKLGDKLCLPTELDQIDVNGCFSSLTSLRNLSRLPQMSRGLLPLQTNSQLITLKIQYMNLANIDIKLPHSITKIEMYRVTISALCVQELCHHFQRLPHAVTFEIYCCTIEPLDDYKQFIKKLQTMTDVEIDISGWGDTNIKIRFNCNTSAASSER